MANIALPVNDPNSLRAYETAARTRLEGLGHTVTLYPGSVDPATISPDAAVLLTGIGTTTGGWADADFGIYDLRGTGLNLFSGGTTNSTTSLLITIHSAAPAELTGGYVGGAQPQVYTSDGGLGQTYFTTDQIAPNALLIARPGAGGNSGRYVIYAADAGVTVFNGHVTPARRVQWIGRSVHLENLNWAGAGGVLFDAHVAWVIGPTQNPWQVLAADGTTWQQAEDYILDADGSTWR